MSLDVASKHVCYRKTISKPHAIARWYEDDHNYHVVVTRERSGYLVWDTSQSDGEINTIVNFFPYSRDQAIEWAVAYGQRREIEIIARWERELEEHRERELQDARDQGREPTFYNGNTGFYEAKAKAEQAV